MRRLLAFALLTLLVPAAALAGCTLAQPSNMNLGTYTGALSTIGSTDMAVSCDIFPSGSYSIGINAGTGAGATTSNRKMTGPASATLNYGLFRDAAGAQNWGNTAGVDRATGNWGFLASSQFTIHPRIPAGQFVAPGTYIDTVVTASSGLNSGTRTFTVTTVVSAACSISATALNFGTYVGVQLDATANLFVTCTNTTPYYVNLGDGLNRDGNFLPRASGPGGVLLSYTPFRDAARTLRWGNTYNSDGIAGTGNGSAQTLTVYGRVFAAQFVTPGTYTDTIIATVTY
jgi:spore coat protein U-like protein